MHPSWDAFLTRYRPMARAIAQSFAAPSADADDLVQEAALALFRASRSAPERFASAGHARNYFLRTVKNLALRGHRRPPTAELSTEGPPDPREPANDPATAAVRRRQDLLGEVVLALDEPDRELVARRFLRRQTLARVAEETGVPVSTLHAREKSLLAKLRRELERREREAAG